MSTELIWASDEKGNLIHFDFYGNLLHTICTCESKNGYHTVSKQGDLLYTERYNRTIYKITFNGRRILPTPFLTTGEWMPWCIHFSTINESIILGMKKDKEWKLSTYNKEGTKVRDIQMGAGGTKLYQSISYVTENINGDICSSDYLAGRVVVVNKSGEHQFSYSWHNSEGVYTPYGICTDDQGHIFVCSSVSCGQVCHEVHILAQDGQFLSLLPLPGDCPRAICVDNHHRIYVATERSNITVYKYTPNTDK
ncbi:uncharacterized protein LOC134251486 [Saccostrea cucullata]|uniref:uncharacterized protein LOC134251486 n=1 Tax=Saccostrea cuccullata TaxID=36930 RepID=UPI002ED3D371